MNVIIIYNTEPDTRILCGLDVFYLLFNFKFIGVSNYSFQGWMRALEE